MRCPRILLEILFAPAFEPDALEELRRTKKKLRVLELPVGRPPAGAAPLEGPERARGASGAGSGRWSASTRWPSTW
jgi:hypothetical protein